MFEELIKLHPLPWSKQADSIQDRLLDKNNKLICIINQEGYTFSGPKGVIESLIELANKNYHSTTKSILTTTKPILVGVKS